jgi:hypothetical protein
MLKPVTPPMESVEQRRLEAIRLLEVWGEFIPKKQAIREIVDKPELQQGRRGTGAGRANRNRVRSQLRRCILHYECAIG